MQDILIFATASARIPPMGFGPIPSIEFWDNVRPKSNTCSNVLFLPLYTEMYDEHEDIPYEKFKEYMDEGIKNSPCFRIA